MALFVGDTGRPKPADRYRPPGPAFAGCGIEPTYTVRADPLSGKTPAAQDAPIACASTTRSTPERAGYGSAHRSRPPEGS